MTMRIMWCATKNRACDIFARVRVRPLYYARVCTYGRNIVIEHAYTDVLMVVEALGGWAPGSIYIYNQKNRKFPRAKS